MDWSVTQPVERNEPINEKLAEMIRILHKERDPNKVMIRST